MGADDLKTMFKAAKAQRGGGGSLSKEQLKQLRAQKAAAAQQAALAESQRIKAAAKAAALAAQARPRAAAGMPPPAPRAPSGSMPPISSSRAAVNSSSGRPQVAVIRPQAQQAAQRSVNNRAQEPATPSGDGDIQTSMSSASQQAQMRHGDTDKQSTASTSDVPSHGQGGQAAATTSRSMPDAGSALIGDYSSNDEDSIQGSAATAAEAREAGSQSASGLPQDFFEAAGSTIGEEPTAGGAGRAERTLSVESAASASVPMTSIPKGFFEDKGADAKARGQKLPKKKDPKQEYDNFLKSIASDVQEVDARQEVEAVEAAQDKADQEAFEHGLRLRRIEQLRALSTAPSTAASHTSSPDTDIPAAGALSIGSVSSVVAAGKKRKRNMSVEVDKADGDDSSDEDGDAMLDWRAKTF